MIRLFHYSRLISENSVRNAKVIASVGSASQNNGNSRSSSSSVYSAHQQSPFMKKLLNKKGGKTTKKRWFEPHFKESLEYDSPKMKNGPSERHLTRLRQVSHVLYDKVSHLINSGELCQEILEKQVNITSVKFHKNMDGINIFWDADRSDWEVVEKLLDSKKGKLRGLLISYRVLGSIPPITFVKAKQTYNMSQLSHLLDVADYGPDYIPGQTPKEISRQEREERESSSSDHSLSDHDTSLRFEKEGENSQFSNLRFEEDEFQNSFTYFDAAERWVENGNTSFQNGKERQFIQEENNSIHISCIETLNQVKKCDSENHSDASVMTQLNFRSDLYGLKRDDLLKKISAKKKGLPLSESKEAATISFNLKSAGHRNAVLGKELEKRVARKEKKMKAKLLERDVSDFL